MSLLAIFRSKGDNRTMQTQEDDDVEFSWASLIAPVGPEDFEREYSGKKPLHLPARELPDCGLGTIDGWRSMLRGQSSRIQGHGVVVDLDPIVDGALPLAPDLETLLRQGGPLIVNAVNRINPIVEGIANALASGLGGGAVANGYISPHRKDTLDLHADDHEVVVLQLRGVKSWTIGSQIAKGLAEGIGLTFRVDVWTDEDVQELYGKEVEGRLKFA